MLLTSTNECDRVSPAALSDATMDFRYSATQEASAKPLGMGDAGTSVGLAEVSPSREYASLLRPVQIRTVV